MAHASAKGQSNPDRASLHAFLSDLDDLAASSPSAVSAAGATPSTTVTAPGGTSTASSNGPAPEDAQSVLDFLDEITQRSSTPTAPVPKRQPPPISRQTSGGNVRTTTTTTTTTTTRSSTDPARNGKAATPSTPPPARRDEPVSPGGGWGWSSMWNSASSVIQQARTVAEENIKSLPQGAPVSGEQANKWKQGVMELVTRGVDVEKLRRELQESAGRTLTDIINAVAPPIAEHEVIQVWLSHDMAGYDGVETLAYRALAKIMEQVEGGDIVVNKGNEEKPTEPTNDDERELNAVEGLQEAFKLAEASLDAMVKRNFQSAQPPDAPPGDKATSESPQHSRSASTTATAAITYCPVYMRVQPCLAPLPYLPSPTETSQPAENDRQLHLFFWILLRDPTHGIVHRTLTQALPGSWLDIPFEENEWVEDNMVDVIRKGVETVGQAYIMSRHVSFPSSKASEAKEGERISTPLQGTAAASAVPAADA